MGVGAGFGFAGEAEACWLGAAPPLETKARMINKMIRITGCMGRQREGQSAPHLLAFEPELQGRLALCRVTRVQCWRDFPAVPLVSCLVWLELTNILRKAFIFIGAGRGAL